MDFPFRDASTGRESHPGRQERDRPSNSADSNLSPDVGNPDMGWVSTGKSPLFGAIPAVSLRGASSAPVAPGRLETGRSPPGKRRFASAARSGRRRQSLTPTYRGTDLEFALLTIGDYASGGFLSKCRLLTESTDSVLSRSSTGMHINLIVLSDTFIVSCPISAQGEPL